jgi:NAD(P)-dependent dehydrogenase (short-subunit alcohol dehydrogenase family)
MPDPIAPPTVLVTGAAKRIGYAIALDLAQSGWRVVAHYNSSRADAEALVAAAATAGGAVHLVQGDLADPRCASDVVDAACAIAREHGSQLTALINNASRFAHDEWHTLTLEALQQHMAINCFSATLAATAFAAQLPANQKGAVINLIDQRVLRQTPDFLSYTISKSALWSATISLAQALAPRVRVNAIGPGPTLANTHQDNAVFEAEARAVPLRQAVDPADICAAVRYLLSAEKVTGQMIAVDSGQHIAWETPDFLLGRKAD